MRCRHFEGQRSRTVPDRCVFLPDIREHPGQPGVFRDFAGWTAAGCARPSQQCLAAVFVPPVYAYRVCARQDVRALNSALVDHLDTAVAVVLFSGVPGRGGLVCRQSLDCQRDLHCSVVWILLLALLSQAISALVKWRVIASGALLGIFFIPSVFGEVINQLFQTRWGNIISLSALMTNISAGLFGTFVRTTSRMSDFDGAPDIVTREIVMNEPPLWASWLVLALICIICLALLSRKVKAYEVIK